MPTDASEIVIDDTPAVSPELVVEVQVDQPAPIVNTSFPIPQDNATRAPPRLERLPDVLARYPVGKSTWWAGVKSGRYPAPVKLAGVNCTAWRSEDIDALIAEAS